MVKAVILLALAAFASARWEETHEYSPSVSKEIADAIKAKLYLFSFNPDSITSTDLLTETSLLPWKTTSMNLTTLRDS